ncbi:MAG TPA: membrane dipeptidase [Verrucomicrobiae bacterium]|nr:membrane dipeptidase [Verrucomicrobiae bacterium]
MIDVHQDLAWSAMYFNRDLLKPIAEIRAYEAGLTDEPGRARNTISFPELRRAKIGVCVTSLLARSGPGATRRGSNRANLDYAAQTICHSHAKGQLAYYRLLKSMGHVRIITTRAQLKSHWQDWTQSPETTPWGLIISMEGADPIVSPPQVEHWWQQGLRAVGPAHYGHSHYAAGTGVDGPLTAAGRELLKEFMRVGMILDATHLADVSFFEALEIYDGPVLASHHNCRALVPGDRQLSDEQIALLIQRKAIIGAVFDAWMLYPGWKRGVTQPEVVGIEAAADHVDHICQIAGNANHCALGTDLDGGFGTEQTPRDVDTITDIHKLEEIFARRGYKPEDIDGIFFANALRFFSEALPK